MRTIKQIGYKLIIVLCIMSTICCFIGSTPAQAASKVKTEEYYYSGTTKGSYTVDKGFVEKLVEALGAILDYILGIATMGFRIVFVGWTELLEKCLTWLIEGASGEEIDVEGVDATGIIEPDDYITLESIVFNHIPLLDINIFNFEADKTHNNLGDEIDPSESTITDDSLIVIWKKTVSGWYYSFRVISIMVMLILLIYIGIKLAIVSSTRDRAVYKQILTDWLVGMVLVFSIHFVILAIIQFNELLVDIISNLRSTYVHMEVYEYGNIERATEGVTNTEMEISLYDEVRTRAYDAKLTIGTTGMVMYMILVYYAWKFTFIYLKRYLVVSVLVIMAPVVVLTYAYNKVRSGKATIFSKWLKELFFIVILQSIHALMYVVFLESALAISLSSIGGMILSFVMMNFMTKAEGIFRKIFDIKGNLTNSTAHGKLSDIKNFVNSAALGVGATKAAVNTTKFAARVVTKPVRAAGNVAFGKLMEHRANELSRKNKEAREHGLATAKELDEADEITRQNKIKLGELAKNIKDGNFGNNKAAIEAKIAELMADVPMANEDGSAMSKEQYIDNFNKQQGKYLADYEAITKKTAVYKHEIKTRWKQIMDPFQYVEKDENGEYKRIKTKRAKESWGPLLKRMSKKVDGTDVVLSKYMNSEYLLGLDKKQKAALKAQAELIKDAVVGFSGILLGLPLLVAEPSIGVAFLSKGIASSQKLYGGQGRVKQRNLKNMVMTADGKYHLVGFEGKSAETIANGAQEYAKEAVAEIETARVEHNRRVVKRTKKHKKLYDRLTGTLKVGAIGASTGATLHMVSTLGTAAPVAVGTVGGIAAGTVLTGHLLGNLGANAYTAFQNTIREERRANAKTYEEQLKSTDSMLDYMAERYYQVEEQKQGSIVDRHTQKFEESYAVAMTATIAKVDEMDDARILRENNYEEDFSVEIKPDGTKKLATDVEKKLIDDAIIETVQKCGIINIQECDLNTNKRMKQVNKIITDKLIQKGIITKEDKVEDVIEDLEQKIERQKLELDLLRPNAVEEKMTDDAIISVMKERDIVDPTQVETGDVMQKFNEKYQKMSAVPLDDSMKAIEKLTAQKMTQNEKTVINTTETMTIDSEEIVDRVQSSIVARRTSLADKSKKKLDDSAKQKLKDELKKKKLIELDTMILTKQEELDSGVVPEEDGSQEVNNTDDIIKMLQLQSALHKDKERLSLVKSYTDGNNSKERIKSYKAEEMLFNRDGSVRIDAFREGTRRVVERQDLTTTSSEMSIEDVLKKVKSQIIL